MPGIISFLSDFGVSDPYVGTVKAVMLGIARDLIIVDVTHEVTPQAVAQAVFLAEQAWPFFPSGTVHLAVVDPGVGSDRAAVALRFPDGYAVGPDNGVLSAALPAEARGDSDDLALSPRRIAVPAGVQARRIESPVVIRQNVSATFHGRDVFGPAAASLVDGFPFELLGPSLAEIWALPRFAARRTGRTIQGEVIHVDRFGNLITTIRAADIPAGGREVAIAGRSVRLVRTYADGTGLVALVGSSGYLEVAEVNGSAARVLGLGIGTAVEIDAE